MPEQARHDADICPFCIDKAAQNDPTTSRIPPVIDGPDVSGSTQVPTITEGGTPQKMTDTKVETISMETHAALLEKAIKDATSATEAALERKTTESAELAAKVEALTAEKASLTTDNERLNKELDTAQLSLKTATDEVATLKADIAAKDEAASKAEVASKRVEQVKNLGLFDEKYVTEKASAWADLADDAWVERLEEWKTLKPVATGDGESTETASALTGTTETLTKTPVGDAKSNARRAALGLN